MKTFRPTPRGWLMPRLALYWRRRRRPLRAAYRPAPASANPSSPIAAPSALSAPSLTLVSVQHHFHRPHHTTRLFSRSVAVSWRLPQPPALFPRVSERIVVKRVIEARPIDGPEMLPATLHLRCGSSRVARPLPSAGRRLFPTPGTTAAPNLVSPAGSAKGRVPVRAIAPNTVLTYARQRPVDRARAETSELTHTIRTRRERLTELVRLDWRRRSAKRSGDTAATPAVPASAPIAGSGALARSAGTAAPATERSTHAGSRSATASVVVDSAAVDRLADTVIQRIERRVRIERERRGL